MASRPTALNRRVAPRTQFERYVVQPGFLIFVSGYCCAPRASANTELDVGGRAVKTAEARSRSGDHRRAELVRGVAVAGASRR